MSDLRGLALVLLAAAAGGCTFARMFAEPRSAEGTYDLWLVRGADSVRVRGPAQVQDHEGTQRGPAMTLLASLPRVPATVLPLGDSITREARLDVRMGHRPANGRFAVSPVDTSRGVGVHATLWSLGGGPRWEARRGTMTVRGVHIDVPTRLGAELDLVLVSAGSDTVRVRGTVSTRRE